MREPRHILVAVAWPYASGSRHLGHLAGAYLPADIYARFQRLRGHRVLMVSGSDVHGTPITVRADQEGISPQELVDRYHGEFLAQWEALGISWDLFTSTGTRNHHQVTQDVFLRLLEHGHIDLRTTRQFFDPEAGRFLPDRYVEGTCPFCGYAEARGDQCDNCGRTLDPEDLVDARSRLSGATPEQRETDHFFLRLSDFSGALLDWFDTREGWRKHVLNWSRGFVEEGLLDRAITRDLEWGVEVPVGDLGPGKRIYVWFDAVIGYLSASKEWAQRSGEPEAWRAWWEDEGAESYYFVGKDNIPFHTVIWPSMLMGYHGLSLPTNVPANQYVTFRGEKASASRSVGRPIGWYLERLQPDAIRYAVAANLPEHSDSDITEGELIRRINEELVATWGNLVNRVLTITGRTFQRTVPEPGPLDDADHRLLAGVDATLASEAEQLESVELRAGLRVVMDGAAQVNAYLNGKEPWKTAKTDLERTATTLHTALQAINGLKVGFAPFLPFSSAAVHGLLGQKGSLEEAGWSRTTVQAGTSLPEPHPLFDKVDAELSGEEPDG